MYYLPLWNREQEKDQENMRNVTNIIIILVLKLISSMVRAAPNLTSKQESLNCILELYTFMRYKLHLRVVSIFFLILPT